MRLKHFVLLASIVVCALAAHAVPARPGFHAVVGPDGKTVMVEMRGDEYFHYFVDQQGRKMVRGTEGALTYIADDEFENRMASAAKSRVAPAEIKRTFPTTGTVRGLVILCEFPDRKFHESSSREYFDAKINQLGYEGDETFGSVADFFNEQSKGVFTPVFDVVGPVLMSQPTSYYAANLPAFFKEACTLADTKCDVDYSRYDVDDDGFVDFIFCIFAGYSQAQSLNSDDIWPASMHLDNYVYDLFDNMYLGVAACSNELKGARDVEHDGIGTICHEFSHILGLPDIYDSRYSGGYGMNHYDIMDLGTYNGDGKVPSGYTAMDRYTLGWLDPVILEGEVSDFELPNIIESNQAVFIVNPDNDKEYFTLENRQQVGFDSALPGHGLIISQINYDSRVWKLNTVNSPAQSGFEHVALITADNLHSNDTEAADPFPGILGVTAFSADTKPAAKWISTDTKCDVDLSNIRETEDGRILFDFGKTAGVNEITDSAASMTVAELIAAGAEVYNVAGQRMNKAGQPVDPDRLVPGIYIVNYKGESRKFNVR